MGEARRQHAPSFAKLCDRAIATKRNCEAWGVGLGLMCAYKIRIQRLRTGYDNLALLKKMVHKLRDEWSKGSKAA